MYISAPLTASISTELAAAVPLVAVYVDEGGVHRLEPRHAEEGRSRRGHGERGGGGGGGGGERERERERGGGAAAAGAALFLAVLAIDTTADDDRLGKMPARVLERGD